MQKCVCVLTLCLKINAEAVCVFHPSVCESMFMLQKVCGVSFHHLKCDVSVSFSCKMNREARTTQHLSHHAGQLHTQHCPLRLDQRHTSGVYVVQFMLC